MRTIDKTKILYPWRTDETISIRKRYLSLKFNLSTLIGNPTTAYQALLMNLTFSEDIAASVHRTFSLRSRGILLIDSLHDAAEDTDNSFTCEVNPEGYKKDMIIMRCATEEEAMRVADEKLRELGFLFMEEMNLDAMA